MKKRIETEIEIDAPAEKVWQILIDFDSYPSWNPFIKSIKGNLAVGEKLEAFIQPTGAKGMTFKPTILAVEREKELRWLGKLFVSALFSGEHIFQIETLGENRVRFRQSENFSGLFVRFLAKSLDTDTLRGFKEMNEALKSRAEKTDAD